ncbi:MAG: sugar transferase [Bacteroidales bacterium]
MTIQKTNKIRLRWIYISADTLAALISWLIFFSFRKIHEGFALSQLVDILLSDINFLYGLFFIPLFWLLLNTLTNYYRLIYHKSRMQDITKTFVVAFIGTLILFFLLVLDDYIGNYIDYYVYFIALFLSYFPVDIIFRLILTSSVNNRIHQRKLGFNTLLIGNGPKAAQIYQHLLNEKRSSGNLLVGYIALGSTKHDAANSNKLSKENGFPKDGNFPCLGQIEDIENILKIYKIEEVLIITEKDENQLLGPILAQLIVNHLIIKIAPDTESILLGAVHSYSVFNEPFILLSYTSMPIWQKCIKRFWELIFCVIAGIFLAPILIYTAWRVKKSSPGPIFYVQERLGLHSKPFHIYKFRSMYINAEKDTPLLANDSDQRVTPFGKIMRKYRLDELPQLYNVIIGNMALVGPRPEREYFVKQIAKIAPHYRLLFNVKPGITSWGETQYGYAENVPQMIERLKYDLIYMENISLLTDFKILLYTIAVIFRGEGK